MEKKILIFCFFFICAGRLKSQEDLYTHADTLRGSNTDERAWWDVVHYNLHASFYVGDSSVSGCNVITYRVEKPAYLLQLDLREPMLIDSVVQNTKRCNWKRDGQAFMIMLTEPQLIGTLYSLQVYFHGKPQVAKLPPWDGGLVWTHDSKDNSWISIACQGIGASVWYPCKDQQYDEVDSASIHITAPENLVSVSNGRLRSKSTNGNGTATYNWVVKNPINNYNIIPYIGKYVNFKDTFLGEAGILDLDFWVLEENLAKARQQFTQVKPMLKCFEKWFGPYPFYGDGYKLVEAPYLGMEHQSAVAYGNKFENGYKGRDLSLTGWGLKWDFIIIHESGHEWFANNITAKDVADNWIHEGFTTYSENLYTEFLFGKEAGSEYVIGTRNAVLNDKPVIGVYGVNVEGSGDMYYKGANMLHTIRYIVNNDSLWMALLRDMNRTFWHQTVTSRQVEEYMISYLKIDLQKMFDQYLRTTKIPVLEYKISKNTLHYRWANCVEGFYMPVDLIDRKATIRIYPSEEWKTSEYKSSELKVSPDFYIKIKKVS